MLSATHLDKKWSMLFTVDEQNKLLKRFKKERREAQRLSTSGFVMKTTTFHRCIFVLIVAGFFATEKGTCIKWNFTLIYRFVLNLYICVFPPSLLDMHFFLFTVYQTPFHMMTDPLSLSGSTCWNQLYRIRIFFTN